MIGQHSKNLYGCSPKIKKDGAVLRLPFFVPFFSLMQHGSDGRPHCSHHVVVHLFQHAVDVPEQERIAVLDLHFVHFGSISSILLSGK